ncbi:transglycosylase SLT domain-containing protein [Thermoleophilia bacterium SCSIO 60948]|nr:transglycosylase SLT domain-containing protein [Thermoleophilia bacterium SCSIO 60948]
MPTLGAMSPERREKLDFALRAGAGLGLVCLIAGAIVWLALALGIDDGPAPAVEAASVAADANEIARSSQASGGAEPQQGRPERGDVADPLVYEEPERKEFEQRAAGAFSHVIYAKSPDGVVASAERTTRYRDEIEKAAAAEDVDPDVMEAIIFLESAGRPTAMAGPTPDAASGLGQIIPSTATDLLGMKLDLAQSIALTKQINKAAAKGDAKKVEQLTEQREQVDERFDPEKAIAGTARYLRIATDRFGRTDLAIASYHMGIGNLENVLRSYAAAGGSGDIGELVAGENLSYAKVYFDSSPARNPATWDQLASFGDESSAYLWKVLASRDMLATWRDDPDELQSDADLANEKASLEEVFHPEGDTEIFDDADEIDDATEDKDLLPLPNKPSLGWEIDPQMGELAKELDEKPTTYRALKPEALAALSYLAGTTAELSGNQPLEVTSTVRDLDYQDLLIGSNPEATQEYSLHTTGWSFDVLREYSSDKQARSFQFALDRMRAVGLLDYAVEPAAIHVTVSDRASVLLD